MNDMIDLIKRLVSEHYGTRLNDMGSIRKGSRICHSRHVAMYLARHVAHASYDAIGKAFNRNHTSVMYGVNNVTERCIKDAAYSVSIYHLRKEVEAAYELQSSLRFFYRAAQPVQGVA
jgi:chromosomal replication initiator protein